MVVTDTSAKEVRVTANGSLVAAPDPDELTTASPGDALIARLDDPQVAASLSLILDHADLLATLVVGLDGMIRRGDVIGDNVVSALDEVKGAAAGYKLPDVDLGALRTTLTELTTTLLAAAPTFTKLLQSPLTDPQTIEVMADVGDAVVEARTATAADPRGPKGVFGLMKMVKDPDVSRGLGFMIHVARAFGQRLAAQPPRPTERGARHSA